MMQYKNGKNNAMQDKTTLKLANTSTNAMGITAKITAITMLTSKPTKLDSISKIQLNHSMFSNREKSKSPSLPPSSSLSAKSYTNL